MKRFYAMAVGVFMSVFLVSAANAAPAETPNKPEPQQGITNAKKAMQSKLERDKKVRQTKEKGYAQKQRAQSGK